MRPTISLRIDAELLERIDRDAEAAGEARSEWMEQAAEARLGSVKGGKVER